MPTMKVVQVGAAGGPLEVAEREIPEPAPRTVRVKVHACGICHSDVFVHDGLWPGIEYPRVPGHEVAGVIDAVGPEVEGWSVGDRVGVGWHGGHCFHCRTCRRGDFIVCENGKITGLTHDGGYGQYMIAPAESLARVPDALDFAEAAPLLCAGITTYNALRNSGARSGDLVAIQGVGGLGHLGVQFARQMGFQVAAISRGADKAEMARELGAHRYIDAKAEDPGAALEALGGARVILATAPHAPALGGLVEGLGIDGVLLIVAAPDGTFDVSPISLIIGRRAVRGWPSGHGMDSEETLRFAAMTGVRPMIERYDLERAQEAYDRAMTGTARFRVVLDVEH